MIGVCLALLLDGSGSVPNEVFARMVEAHASAMLAPVIQSQIEREGLAVRVVVIEDEPRDAIGWTVLRSPADTRRFAQAMQSVEKNRVPQWTPTGDAIHHVLETAEADIERLGCERTIIDVATDGQSNYGRLVETARDRAQEIGVTINAVTVETNAGADNPGQWARERLITQDGFVVEANSWDDWMRAIRKKLVMEIGSR